jgi:hypothetical protein
VFACRIKEVGNGVEPESTGAIKTVSWNRSPAVARPWVALVADRIDQDPGDISIDGQTGQILGALSDAARAARYAIAQRIILKGGEDPGWGH